MKQKYFMLSAALAFSSSVFAEDFSKKLQHLEDYELRQVFAQGLNLNVVLPHLSLLQRQLIQDTIHHLTHVETQQGSMNHVKQIFQTMPNGQLKMQIDREVISIGVIEFRLNFDGLTEMGESMMSQISIN